MPVEGEFTGLMKERLCYVILTADVACDVFGELHTSNAAFL